MALLKGEEGRDHRLLGNPFGRQSSIGVPLKVQ
jgi:hypothetical protein